MIRQNLAPLEVTGKATPFYEMSANVLYAMSQEAHKEYVVPARQDRLRSLLVQYRDDILAHLPPPSVVGRFASDGHVSMPIHYCFPPIKTTEYFNGQVFSVPLHTPDLTHFSGFKGIEEELVNPTDHSINGIPRVSLIQGFRQFGQKIPNPWTLPDGKTVVDLLNEWASGTDNICFRTLFVSKQWYDGRLVTVNRLEIHMVWDLVGWTQQHGIRPRPQRLQVRIVKPTTE